MRLGNHPLDPAPIAVSKVLGASHRHFTLQGDVDDVNRIGVEYARDTALTQLLGKVDLDRQRRVGVGQRCRDGQPDRHRLVGTAYCGGTREDHQQGQLSDAWKQESRSVRVVGALRHGENASFSS